MNVVVTSGLVKRYGSRVALDGLDITIPRGSIAALIGPNGSGKTTAFGVLAGLLAPSSGRVDLFGEGPFDPARHAGRVGLMPQDSLPSPHASVYESLRYYAELSGLPRSRAEREASDWLARVHLDDRRHSKLHQLSHGMRRRFSIAQAFLGAPELILLDEPTAGLDPELAAQMRSLFAECRGRATLVVSSHVLSELEELCDYAMFIEGGRCQRQGPMRSLLLADQLVRLTLSRKPDFEGLSRQLPSARFDWKEPELTVQFGGPDTLEAANAKILRALLDQQVGILGLAAGQRLEASYLAGRSSS